MPYYLFRQPLKRLVRRVMKRQGCKSPQLYSPKERIHNYLWVFKVGDADDHPSVPHAHSKEEGYRLNAWNGEIYPAGNDRSTVIGKLSNKELSRLHKDKKFIDHAVKQIEWYSKAYPYIRFHIPVWFSLAHNMKKGATSQRVDNAQAVYVFLGKASLNRK